MPDKYLPHLKRQFKRKKPKMKRKILVKIIIFSNIKDWHNW